MRLIVDGCKILINEVVILSVNHLFVTLGLVFVLGFFLGYDLGYLRFTSA